MRPPSGPDLKEQAKARHLSVLGHFRPGPDDGLADDTACLLLIGPRGEGWDDIAAAPEFADGGPDPLDRWSRRVLGDWAEKLGAKALFPFGGAPFHPFQTWALRTGRMVASPIGFLCHVDQGLMVSFRGALALPFWPDGLDGPAPDPCAACAGQPCRDACPADALTPQGYDVAACHGWLDRRTPPDCRAEGCAVRLSCPLSAGAGRNTAQSAFHMRAFHP